MRIDRRTVNKFRRAYRNAGGWTGQYTMTLVLSDWENLRKACHSITASAAGQLLAAKYKLTKEWRNVVISNSGVEAVYAVNGKFADRTHDTIKVSFGK